MDHKLIQDQLLDKNKSLEELLSKSELSQVIEVKEMEKQMELRVAKIIQQKEMNMKQEKQMIMEKFKLKDEMINDLKKQTAQS